MIASCYHCYMATLKELREKLFFSQRDLAQRAGTVANTINRLEKSKQKPMFRTIRKLAQALGVKPEEIVFSVPQEKGTPGRERPIREQPARKSEASEIGFGGRKKGAR